MPNVHLAPAEIRALLRLLTETSTRDGALITATTKLGEALDNARTRRENRQLDQHTAATLRRNREIEQRNAELYDGWHDREGEQPGYENGQPVYYTTKLDNAGRLTTTSRPRDPEHCHKGHNKRLTRCQCDQERWPEAK